MSEALSPENDALAVSFLEHLCDDEQDTVEATNSDLELSRRIDQLTRDEHIDALSLENRKGWYRFFNQCMRTKHKSTLTNNIVSKWRSLWVEGTGRGDWRSEQYPRTS
jgi:hypothetical protein